MSDYSTMGLGGTADYLVEVASKQEVAEAVRWAKDRAVSSIMIGGGSNIFWSDEGYRGLVIVNKILGYETFEEGEHVVVHIGAGENWDSVVARTVETGLTGIEALSLIPGTAGGTPVQNVGAYGQEIANTLVSVEAYDTELDDFVSLKASDCGFSYRNSRFKSTDRGRFMITSLTLQLTKGNPQPPFYASVAKYFTEKSATEFTPAKLREAVVAIRTAKLPDPAVVKNNGSFFANPILAPSDFETLLAQNENIPSWPADEGVKVSAAWLIEQAGYKDYHDKDTGMATWPQQALVLINESARSTADLLVFKKKIVDAVNDKFGITLQQEPELL